MNPPYPWVQALYHQLMEQYQAAAGASLPVVLISEPMALGADSLIESLTNGLLCSACVDNSACRRCTACQLALHNGHPDRFSLPALELTATMEQVRSMQQFLNTSPQIGSVKTVCITGVEGLSLSATNALLKTLEEPPDRAAILLSTAAYQTLPMTLVSRCDHWKLKAPRAEDALCWLKKTWPDRAVEWTPSIAKLALHWGAGSPLKALEYATMEVYQKREAFFKLLTQAVAEQNWFLLLGPLALDDPRSSFFWLSTILLDTAKFSYGCHEHCVNADQFPLMQLFAARVSHIDLPRYAAWVLECCTMMGQHDALNTELLFAELLTKFTEHEEKRTVFG